MSLRTRFAPSPTGYLHIGGARTALYCWLQARKENGVFVLRIEDTDRERSTPEAVEAILEGMEWLGMKADEGPIYQTDRLDRYDEITNQLLSSGHAYHCHCSQETLEQMRDGQRKNGEKPRYDQRCRELGLSANPDGSVVRFKFPVTGTTQFDDQVCGTITFQNDELDDLIIRRSDSTPTYNLTVVVDDMDMNITLVIRGDDHINNTPRQIAIFKALGASPPKFAHLPMILGEDGARLSKRHGAVSVLAYKEQGILPSALLNYLVRLGWSHGDVELFSMEDMIRLFDVKDVNRSASSFNLEKLLWINKQHMMEADPAFLADLLTEQFKSKGLSYDNGPSLTEVVVAFRERANTLIGMIDQTTYLYNDDIETDPGAAKKHLRPVVIEPLKALRDRLENMANWNEEAIDNVLGEILEQFDLKLGKVAQPLRVAVTGGASSPPIGITLQLIGKERSLKRLATAITFCEDRAAAG